MASLKLRQDIQQIVNGLETHGDVAKYRLATLQATLFRKFLGTPGDEHAKHVQALERFSATNERIKKFNSTFQPSELTRYMADDLAFVFQSEDPLSLNICANLGKCGPGASFGHKGDADFFTKMFDGALTHTSEALMRHYRHTISDRWLSAETIRSQRHPAIRVDGSKITTVPKDDSKRRTICTEPVLNMFYQLGAKKRLEQLLKRHHNIDVANQQEHNRRMASLGSLTGKFATIDLSDASDSISTSLVKCVLPTQVFDVLNLLRADKARVGSEWVPLHMFSTMGNGFTFVLMTFLFSALVRSTYRINGIHPKANVNYAVFGDDIIVLGDMYPHILRALDDLGFIPNQDKSFHVGPFRESCGGDYFHGHDVRGVYCKGLNNEADLYSLFNRLVRWSCASGINIDPLLEHIVRNFSGLVHFVPPDCSDTAGVKVPSVLAGFANGRGGYKYLSPRPRRFRSTKRVIANTDGAITAFIGGYLGNTVTLRPEVAAYKVTSGFTPVWDRREVWDELCSSSSTIKCWSSNDDQEAIDMLTRVLIRGLIFRLEAA